MVIGDTLERNRRFYPNRLAVTDGIRRITHGEFTNRVFQLMHGLSELGLSRGDRVAVLLSNVPEIMELYFAVPFSGMIIVPLNYRLSPKEIESQVEDSGARVMVVEKQFAEKIRDLRSSMKGVRHFISVGAGEDPYLPYDDLLSNHPATIPEGIEVSEQDIAYITYTSGTTGRPKGIVLTHKNILTQVYGQKGFSGRWAGDGTDVIMSSYPLFHNGVIGNLSGLIMGMQNVIWNFNPQTIYGILEKEKITVWCTAPVMLEMTFGNGINPEEYDLSKLNFISSAGQPIRLSTVKKALEVFSNPDLYFAVGLGLSETFSWVNFSHITRANLERVEKLITTLPLKTEYVPAGMGGPLPHQDLKIVDDNGKEEKAGRVGEIIVKGDNIMKGYWRNPKETAETIKGGWLHTGDLGMRHPDDPACTFVVGRKKEMIISGAENIYPSEVELVLLQHPAVTAAAVFGIPDEKWGEAIKAAVILKPGIQASEEEIIQFCRQNIASYKKPTGVYFVDDFPRNSLGKVIRKDLARMAMDRKLQVGKEKR